MTAAPDVDADDRPVAVFDIDGVLADVSHRLHYLQSYPQRWDRFFAAADRDPLLAEGAARLRAALVDHDVLYLTGRPERSRRLTKAWLRRHGLPTGPLIMREDEDYRPARWMKREVRQRDAPTSAPAVAASPGCPPRQASAAAPRRRASAAGAASAQRRSTPLWRA